MQIIFIGDLYQLVLALYERQAACKSQKGVDPMEVGVIISHIQYTELSINQVQYTAIPVLLGSL